MAAPPYAIYAEYQLRPEPDKLPLWSLKWSGLCRELSMEVVLLVIYLEKGDRATFPATFAQSGGGLQTTLSFNTVRLWEHRDKIASGQWPELAPLLVLCETNPTVQMVQQEVDLIRQSGLPQDTQTELLSLAMLVASRSFRRGVLTTIFREEITMIISESEARENLKELFLETDVFEEWLQDPRVSGKKWAEVEAAGIARGRVEGEVVGLARGREEGKAEGQAEAVRQMTSSILTRRFGELPEALLERIATADSDWCQSLVDRAITATSLSELTDTL